jgi:hypothetical protein
MLHHKRGSSGKLLTLQRLKLNRVTLKDIIFEVLCRMDDIRSQVTEVIRIKST